VCVELSFFFFEFFSKTLNKEKIEKEKKIELQKFFIHTHEYIYKNYK